MAHRQRLPRVSPEAEQQSVCLRSPVRGPVRHNLRSLLYSVAERLDADDLERMIFLSSDVINSEMEKEGITSGFMLFEIFLKRGVLGDENIDLLLDLLTKIRRFDLNKMAKKRWEKYLQCSTSVLEQPNMPTRSLPWSEQVVSGQQQARSHQFLFEKTSVEVGTSRPGNVVQSRQEQFGFSPTPVPVCRFEGLVSDDDLNLLDRHGQQCITDEPFRGRANAMCSPGRQIAGGMDICRRANAGLSTSTLFGRGECAGESGIDMRKRTVQRLIGEPYRERANAFCSKKKSRLKATTTSEHNYAPKCDQTSVVAPK